MESFRISSEQNFNVVLMSCNVNLVKLSLNNVKILFACNYIRNINIRLKLSFYVLYKFPTI